MMTMIMTMIVIMYEDVDIYDDVCGDQGGVRTIRSKAPQDREDEFVTKK